MEPRVNPHARRRLPFSRMTSAVLFMVLASALALAVAPPVRAWDAGSFSSADEQLLFALTNQARASVGLAPLRWDDPLAAVARWRSQDMSIRDYFSHEIPPEGYLVFHYLDQRGIRYVLAGENIGWNNASDGEATSLIQQMFMNSPEHRSIILGRQWDSVGIGAYKGADGIIKYTVLFKQTAAAPKPAPRPTARATPVPTSRPSLRPASTAGPAPTRTPPPPAATAPPMSVPTRSPSATATGTPEPEASVATAATPTPTLVAPSPIAPAPPSPADVPSSTAGSQRIVDDGPQPGLLETLLETFLSAHGSR